MVPDEGNLDPPSSQFHHDGYLHFITTTKMGEKLDNTLKKNQRVFDLYSITGTRIHSLIYQAFNEYQLSKILVIFFSDSQEKKLYFQHPQNTGFHKDQFLQNQDGFWCLVCFSVHCADDLISCRLE